MIGELNVTRVKSPRGHDLTFDCRPDTNDGALVMGILGTDEYRLIGMPKMEGVALDIGSHVGTVAICLAADNPGLRVIAIEPVPENVQLLRRNVARNGVSVEVLEEAAGAIGQTSIPCHFGYTRVDIPDQGYVEQNRFIGNIWREGDTDHESVDATGISLRALAERLGVSEFRFVKIDCEGCEWGFLADDAELCVEIIGEWHDASVADLNALLGATHVVTILDDHGTSGIFRAVRR